MAKSTRFLTPVLSPTMTDSVPNEILELILNYAVPIPSSTFEAWRTPRTFCGSPPSKVSGLLVVSKRWCALGTPALYESAILRTRAQVKALANQLSASSRSKTTQYLEDISAACA